MLHLPLEAVTPLPLPPPPPLIFSPITRGQPPALFQSPTPAKYHEPVITQIHPTAVVFDCSVPPLPTTCFHQQPAPPRPTYDGIQARLSHEERPISPPFSPILSALREECISSPETIIRRESLVSSFDSSWYNSGAYVLCSDWLWTKHVTSDLTPEDSCTQKTTLAHEDLQAKSGLESSLTRVSLPIPSKRCACVVVRLYAN